MKIFTLIFILLSLYGCATNKSYVAASNTPSLKHVLGDGVAEITIPYHGMPKEVAEKLWASVLEQRGKFEGLWSSALNKSNSVSLWHWCSARECSYSFSVGVPCSESGSAIFSPEGVYPSLHFNYLRTSPGLTECCFFTKRKPWYQRLFQ